MRQAPHPELVALGRGQPRRPPPEPSQGGADLLPSGREALRQSPRGNQKGAASPPATAHSHNSSQGMPQIGGWGGGENRYLCTGMSQSPIKVRANREVLMKQVKRRPVKGQGKAQPCQSTMFGADEVGEGGCRLNLGDAFVSCSWSTIHT